MAKKSANIISPTGRQVPFLRGILVQSLVDAGLSFEAAYAVAQAVRNTLPAGESIASDALRHLVANSVEERLGSAARTAYEQGQSRERAILVRTAARTAPYSVGILSRYLEGCAVDSAQALAGARTLHEQLRREGVTEIDAAALRRAVYATLKRDCCAAAADRFLSRSRLEASGQSLILLVGGPSGAGKSTITAQLAYLLDIPHLQSTDMIREIVRSYLAPHLVPTLGYSSFEAWRGLPGVESGARGEKAGNPVIAGFLSQFGVIRPALEAAIRRALKERQDLIVDGVHVLPTHLDLASLEAEAVVVPVTLAVSTKERLAAQLGRRGREQPGRQASRYQDQLDAIWDLQTYMVDEAERAGVPVILNWSGGEAAARILEVVMARVAERFPPDPAALG